jgi:hypothetical protein
MPAEDQAAENAKRTAISVATDWGSKFITISYKP